jgi:predicted phosphodiesterase
MRVAALYDIHGNLPALEAVLYDVRHADVDCVVVGGDVVPGPMPREALGCLLDLALPVQFLRGNGETAVLAEMTGMDPGPLPEAARDVVRWTAQQLTPEDGQVLARWPKVLHLEIGRLGGVLFCHATPRNENECFTQNTPDERVVPMFAGLDVPLVICGHTHMQFERTVGQTRVVNAGSVGMPFGRPGAYWLLLGPGVEARYTPYDLARAADRIRDTPYPQAEDFAMRSVLQPPLQEAMLAVFAKADLT